MAASMAVMAGSSGLVSTRTQDGGLREKVRSVTDCRPYSSLVFSGTRRGEGDAFDGASSYGLVRETHARVGCVLHAGREPLRRSREGGRHPEPPTWLPLCDVRRIQLFGATSSAIRRSSCSYLSDHEKNRFVVQLQALVGDGTEGLVEDTVLAEEDVDGGGEDEEAAISMVVTAGQGEDEEAAISMVVPAGQGEDEEAAISMVVPAGQGEDAFQEETESSAPAEADVFPASAGRSSDTPSTVSFSDSNPYPATLDNSRFAIAGKAQGYGHKATGGRGGKEYKVTNFSSSGQQGTLEYALSQSEPLWITFDQAAADRAKKFQDGRPMIDYTSLPISRRLIPVRSNKTIDGRGLRSPVVLYGCGLKFLAETQNVIVCNICLDGAFREGKGGQQDRDNMDGIQISGVSGKAPSNIWIDRVTFRNYADGLIDITRGSTNITVSRCLLSDHDKAMLIGNSDDLGDVDRRIRVTVHHNKFINCGQRHPRVRFGFVHMYNNSVLHWKTAAVGLGTEAQMLLQQNYFLQGSDNTVLDLKPKTSGRDGHGIASVQDIYNPNSLDINKDKKFASVINNFRGPPSDLPRAPNPLTVEKIPTGEALAKKLDGITGAWPGNKFKFRS